MDWKGPSRTSYYMVVILSILMVSLLATIIYYAEITF